MDILVNCSSIGFETIKEDDRGAFSLKFYTPLSHVDNSIRVGKGDDAERLYLKAASDKIKTNFSDSFEVLISMEAPFVFDIIYQPKQTMLLYLANLLGYKTLNGAAMNLEQAVIAFDKATVAAGLRSENSDEIRDLMSKVW